MSWALVGGCTAAHSRPGLALGQLCRGHSPAPLSSAGSVLLITRRARGPTRAILLCL